MGIRENLRGAIGVCWNLDRRLGLPEGQFVAHFVFLPHVSTRPSCDCMKAPSKIPSSTMNDNTEYVRCLAPPAVASADFWRGCLTKTLYARTVPSEPKTVMPSLNSIPVISALYARSCVLDG